MTQPLYETPVPLADIERGSGPQVTSFLESFCRVTKDGFACRSGELMVMRDWQHERAGRIFARKETGRYRHRQALLGLPRKNGKSALGSGFGIHGLLMSGEGAEIYSCAADKDQARIVFGVAKRMVELDDELSDLIKPYRDVLEVPSTGSIYKALSSEAFTKEGLNPSVVIYDELHAAPNDELYNVMSLGSGARRDPLLIAITTAGVISDQTGQDSICYRLYQLGKKIASGEVDDPSFYMCWYGAPKGADHKDPEVWRNANPGYGDLIDPEDFASLIKKVRENDFRTKRLNQWVSSAAAWLPGGSWDRCHAPGRTGEQNASRGVVLGFDGSRNGDATALVCATVDSEPHVRVLGLWERPENAQDWRVPRGEVKDAIRQACRTLNVREIAWDEFLWTTEAEELEDEGLPVVIFPQTLTRMGPATQRFFELVTTQRITHDGDPRLSRHLDNAQLKVDTRGARLQKDARNSPRKIDLAVASVMSVDRAQWWLTQPGTDTFKGVPVKDIGFVY